MSALRAGTNRRLAQVGTADTGGAPKAGRSTSAMHSGALWRRPSQALTNGTPLSTAVTSELTPTVPRRCAPWSAEVEQNVARLNSDWQRFLSARAARRGHVPIAAQEPPDAAAELEASVDEALAICDGDPRAAVRALIVANDYLESEVERCAR